MRRTNPYYNGPPSDHFDGAHFFNPEHPPTDRSLRDLLRWRLKGTRASWPQRVDVPQVRPAVRVQALRATVIGHATVLIQAGGLNILTDPVWSERASPLGFIGPRRVTAPSVDLARLPPIDVVLLSHNHYDHLDIHTLRQLHRDHRPLLVTPLGNDTIVRRHLPDARIAVGDWGARFALGEQAHVDIVPANHWSSRTPIDRRMALWGGFMLRIGPALVYFAGDTGYGTGAIFRAMHARHGAPDLALLPIGAYAPRWFMAAQHVDPDEAVQIMLDLHAKRALGIHWGDFCLTDEPRDEPAALLQQSLQRRGIAPEQFIAARPGSVID